MIAVAQNRAEHPRRILVVLPSWVGDLVLATPALAAIRAHFSTAHITGLLKPALREVLAGSPWLDEMLFWDEPARQGGGKSGILRLARELRAQRPDLSIALPNSFRSALIGLLSGARRRAGYARQGRSLLLTDRLRAPREGRKFKPAPVLDYYNRLVHHLGTPQPCELPRLFTTSQEEARVDAYLTRVGARTERPLVVLNPGGQYGAAKCWLPDRFARVADALYDSMQAEVFVNVGPHEGAIADDLMRAADSPVHNLGDSGLGLGGLKALVRRSALMITNDTGPRHFAIAFGVPVVTLFGPTHTEWTQTRYLKERIVRVQVDCGPCQLRVCPLDHRCMTRISEEMVLAAATDLVSAKPVV